MPSTILDRPRLAYDRNLPAKISIKNGFDRDFEERNLDRGPSPRLGGPRRGIDTSSRDDIDKRVELYEMMVRDEVSIKTGAR